MCVLSACSLRVFSPRVLSACSLRVFSPRVLSACSLRVFSPCVLSACSLRVFSPRVLSACSLRVFSPRVLSACSLRVFSPCVLSVCSLRVFTPRDHDLRFVNCTYYFNVTVFFLYGGSDDMLCLNGSFLNYLFLLFIILYAYINFAQHICFYVLIF